MAADPVKRAAAPAQPGQAASASASGAVFLDLEDAGLSGLPCLDADGQAPGGAALVRRCRRHA